MSKYLIVNADDFGMCKSANDAVIDLFKSGRLKSSTIMMPCPTAKEAVNFAIDNPQYSIGIHTTLTSEWKTYRWKPLTGGKSLIDSDGFMWHESDMVEKNAKSNEIYDEVKAQIDLAYSMGMKPSHIDNHMGSLYGNKTGRFSLLKLAYKICSEYNLPYRMFVKADKKVNPRGTPFVALKAAALISKIWSDKYNVETIDYLLFPDWGAPEIKACKTYEEYRQAILKTWINIPDGITETFVHPAFDTDELKNITHSHTARFWEYTLLNDPETEKYLNENGVTLITYRDIAQIKSKNQADI